MRKFFICFAFCCAAAINATLAIAQNKVKVTGTVTSAEDGLPVIGAAVMTGPENGTITSIDGEYEIFLKWDPSNAHDNAHTGYTGSVFIDCLKLSGERLWRIDLGRNIRAGAHYTQFLVYDFDGDGDAEIAMKTAPGSKDGLGNYVSTVGDTEEIRNLVTPDTLVAYVYEDNGFESYRDAILYFIDNGIVINNTIEYAFKDIFLSNHNIVSFHNMSLGESEHVLVKK